MFGQRRNVDEQFIDRNGQHITFLMIGRGLEYVHNREEPIVETEDLK
jgi:hypothetical protein